MEREGEWEQTVWYVYILVSCTIRNIFLRSDFKQSQLIVGFACEVSSVSTLKNPPQPKLAVWKQNEIEKEFKYLKVSLKIAVYIHIKEGVELD